MIPFKNLTSLFPLIFLLKPISVYALGRLKWILDIIWPFNQRNWIKQALMINFLNRINCILLHWPKKLTLSEGLPVIHHSWLINPSDTKTSIFLHTYIEDVWTQVELKLNLPQSSFSHRIHIYYLLKNFKSVSISILYWILFLSL